MASQTSKKYLLFSLKGPELNSKNTVDFIVKYVIFIRDKVQKKKRRSLNGTFFE